MGSGAQKGTRIRNQEGFESGWVPAIGGGQTWEMWGGISGHGGTYGRHPRKRIGGWG